MGQGAEEISLLEGNMKVHGRGWSVICQEEVCWCERGHRWRRSSNHKKHQLQAAVAFLSSAAAVCFYDPLWTWKTLSFRQTKSRLS